MKLIMIFLIVFIHYSSGASMKHNFAYYDPHDKLYTCMTLSTEFSFSPNSSIVDDYINSNSKSSIYNYNIEGGLSFSRMFSGMFNTFSHFRQIGILLGSSHFVSGFDEEQSHSLFFQDKSQRGYRTHRHFIHNTHYVTLRAMTSIQLDFMPKNLLLVSGVKFGYKYSERYEDNLDVEDEGVSQYLPQHTVQVLDNGLYQYSILKQDNPSDLLLYSFNVGLSYQIPMYTLLDKDGMRHQRVPHINVNVGVNYKSVSAFGHQRQNFLFYGASCSLTFESL